MSRRKRFSLQLEQLESRHMLSGVAFHNSESPLDVDGDDVIAPLDALIIINRLNGPPPSETDVPSVHFMDVNGDGFVAPLDALLVINYLNHAERTVTDDTLSDVRLTSMMSSSTGDESATITYQRDAEGGVVRQLLQVQVENSQPETTLEISIAGQPVGSVTTSEEGNAELVFTNEPGN